MANSKFPRVSGDQESGHDSHGPTARLRNSLANGVEAFKSGRPRPPSSESHGLPQTHQTYVLLFSLFSGYLEGLV